MVSERLVVISGCSGGGKSTLLSELSNRGYATVEEPGRRVIARAQQIDDDGVLPWHDITAFLRRALALALEDYREHNNAEAWVFFDRGIVDAASGLAQSAGEALLTSMAATHRYHRQVFLTPPWPEIYRRDAERRHDLAQAQEEYQRLVSAYAALGYMVTLLPKISVTERADFILTRLGA